MLWFLTGSRWVFLAVATVTAVHVGYFLTEGMTMSSTVSLALWRHRESVTPSIHALTAAILLTWAIHGRVLHGRPTGCCDSCGYDLTGLGDATTCPECGAKPTGASA